VQTLYHAAAYKHVPLVEHNVVEGIRNNIFGTTTAAEAAVAEGVEAFILISTDKAVRPTNVMGATKRMAEMVCQAWAARQSKTKFSMVRFGNVLGSSGSVIPLFRRQIAEGGPITVTHPEITRYFMTIPEAAQLVIQAGALAQGGDVFVLDMGEPVRIVDLAQRMARLYGLNPVISTEQPLITPGREGTNISEPGDIAITFSALRPGEKLFEELLISNDAAPTAHSQIKTAHEIMLPWDTLSRVLTRLADACGRGAVPEIKQCLKDAGTSYLPDAGMNDLLWLENSQIHPSPHLAAE
jgi:FlaA1/EpsC-like NDP-sugar epimerase